MPIKNKKPKFKFPKELLIKDSIWKVKYVRKFKEHGNTKNKETLGLCDPGEKVIYIKQGLPFQLRLDVLIHEALHSVEFETNTEIKHEHIYLIAEELARIFVDNF